MAKPYTLALCLCAATAGAACSSSSNGGYAPPDAGSHDAVSDTSVTPPGPADMAAALCNQLESCSAILVETLYGDVAACVVRETLALTSAAGAAGSADTPAFYEACAQALPSTTCSQIFTRSYPTACQPKTGSLGAGSACGESGQCQGGYCQIPVGQTCGKCAALGAAGATCTQNDDCAFGSACVQGKCVAFGAANATCSATAPCDPTLACAGGTCQTPLQLGAACMASAGNACDALSGLFCSPSMNKCVAIQVAADGMECGVVPGSLATCSGGSYCKSIGDGGATGICTPPAADGAACDAVMGPPCVSPAVCVGGVCTLPDASACH